MLRTNVQKVVSSCSGSQPRVTHRLAGGRVMYNGDAVAAVDHFSKKLNLDCPVHFNPADFFIDMISINEALDDKGEGDRKRIDAIAKAAEEVRVSSSSELEKGKPKEDGDARSFAAHAGVIKMQGGCACTGRYHSSLFEQFGLLYIRSLRSKVRGIKVKADTLVQRVKR